MAAPASARGGIAPPEARRRRDWRLHSAFIAACEREGAPPPASVQNSYSLLERSDEKGLVEALRHHGVGYLP